MCRFLPFLFFFLGTSTSILSIDAIEQFTLFDFWSSFHTWYTFTVWCNCNVSNNKQQPSLLRCVTIAPLQFHHAVQSEIFHNFLYLRIWHYKSMKRCYICGFSNAIFGDNFRWYKCRLVSNPWAWWLPRILFCALEFFSRNSCTATTLSSET